MITDVVLYVWLLSLCGVVIHVFWFQWQEAKKGRGFFKDFKWYEWLLLPFLIVGESFVWPYLWYQHVKYQRRKERAVFRVEISDLKNKLSIAEIEEKHVISEPLDCVPPQPFGFLNEAWLDFLADANNPENLYYFEKSHGELSLEHHHKGYAALSSDNKVTQYFIFSSRRELCKVKA
ncbi:MAG: hypothetical protein ACPGR2_07900 [Psychrobium sp.]